MKKLSFVLLIATNAYLSAATVRIYNKSKEPVFALVNDQTSAGFDEEEKEGISILTGVTSIYFGIGPLVFALAGVYSRRANVKIIKPGEHRFFNSDFNAIKKVTFFRFPSTPAIPYITNKNIDEIMSQYTLKKYGYPPFVAESKKTYRQELAQWDSNMYNRKDFNPYFNKKTGLYTYYIPKVETFTINPDIDPLTTETKIDYFGWKNAKRVKRKFLGIF